MTNAHDSHLIPKEKIISPAERVIAAFGSQRSVARVIGRNPSNVTRWVKPVEKGGTGGRIPTGVQESLLAEIKARGMSLTAADLIEFSDRPITERAPSRFGGLTNQ